MNKEQLQRFCYDGYDSGREWIKQPRIMKRDNKKSCKNCALKGKTKCPHLDVKDGWEMIVCKYWQKKTKKAKRKL